MCTRNVHAHTKHCLTPCCLTPCAHLAGVWLSEAALQMQRSVDYELPFHKKTATQLDTQLQALKRRHEDITKGAQSAAAHFERTCSGLGIAGHSIAREVSALGATLPKRVEPILGMCRDGRVGGAMDAYSQFAAAAHSAGDAGTHTPTLEQVCPFPICELTSL